MLVVEERFDRLRALRDELMQPRKVFEQIDEKVVENVVGQIQGRRNRFQPLAPRYAAWKRRQVGNRPILMFSGSLLERYRNAGGMTGNIYTYGLNDDIALKHQLGIGVVKRAIDYGFFVPLTRERFQQFVRDSIQKWKQG